MCHRVNVRTHVQLIDVEGLTCTHTEWHADAVVDLERETYRGIDRRRSIHAAYGSTSLVERDIRDCGAAGKDRESSSGERRAEPHTNGHSSLQHLGVRR